MLVYVNMYGSYKLLKTVRFFWPTQYSLFSNPESREQSLVRTLDTWTNLGENEKLKVDAVALMVVVVEVTKALH